ncbi:hypothetical protein HY379_00570 [Candidatus Saccharibacteria bacterium]|nr:hypothetical protein [Candidatus Saccharibacteria bacterium]
MSEARIPIEYNDHVMTTEMHDDEEHPPDVLVEWSILGGRYKPPEPARVTRIEAQPLPIRFIELPVYAIELTGRISSFDEMEADVDRLKISELSMDEKLKEYNRIKKEFSLNQGVRALVEIAHNHAALYTEDQMALLRKSTAKYDKAHVLREINSMHSRDLIGPALRRSGELTIRTIIAWQKGIGVKEPPGPLTSVQ